MKRRCFLKTISVGAAAAVTTAKSSFATADVVDVFPRKPSHLIIRPDMEVEANRLMKSQFGLAQVKQEGKPYYDDPIERDEYRRALANEMKRRLDCKIDSSYP